MRKVEINTESDSIRKTIFEMNYDKEWHPCQFGPYNNLRNKTIEIIHSGPKKLSKSFFKLSESYLGLFVDPGIKSTSGFDLMLFQHYSLNAPPLVSVSYSTDIWHLELMLVFRNQKFVINSGQPIAEGILVHRSEIEVNQVDLTLKKEKQKSERSPTRKMKLPDGTELDNWYEIITKNKKVESRTTSVIFKRNYLSFF